METKTCKKCKKELPLSVFGGYKRSRDGLQYACYSCLAGYGRERSKERRKTDPNFYKRRDRKYSLKSKHNMTVEQYGGMAERQFHRCKICGEPETKKNQGGILPLAVDHDHSSGVIRGLLCNRCNRVLGMVKEDQYTLREMIEYLTETEYE